MKELVKNLKNIGKTEREFLESLLEGPEKIHPMYHRQLLRIVARLDKQLSATPRPKTGRNKTPLLTEGDE